MAKKKYETGDYVTHNEQTWIVLDKENGNVRIVPMFTIEEVAETELDKQNVDV